MNELFTSDEPKTPAVITLDSYDIKPVSLLNVHQTTKVIKNSLTVFIIYRSKAYLCQGVTFSFRDDLEATQHFLFYAKWEIFVN